MTPTPEAVTALWPVIWRIAGAMARRMRGYWSQEELASFGYAGAVGGLRTYNPTYGRSLEDHCARRIKGAMLDGCSIKSWHWLRKGPKKALQRATDREATTLPVEQRDTVDSLLARVSPRHEFILRAYFLDGWSQERIGHRLGVSASAISQSLRTALRHVRKANGI